MKNLNKQVFFGSNYVPACSWDLEEGESVENVPELVENMKDIFEKMKEIPELSHCDETWQVAIANCSHRGLAIWDPKTKKVAFGYLNMPFFEKFLQDWGIEDGKEG